MTNDSPRPEPRDEELVAYLDGELPADQAREFEQRIAAEPALRRRLNELERTWDMLDVLPRSEPTEVFTRSTIELVLGDAIREQRMAVRWRIRRWLAAAAMVLVPLLLGAATFLLIRYWQTSAFRALERDLPVIQNAEFYQRVPGINFLEDLEQIGTFTGDSRDGAR